MGLIELIGCAGILVSVAAYLPQIHHLVVERCSAGVSVPAWMLWVGSTLLIGAHAVDQRDIVFIGLQVCSGIASATIAFLGYRYRGSVCDTHRKWSAHLQSESLR